MQSWLEALRRIVENPAQNATALATGIAIVVLAVIVIALILIALALPGRDREEDSLAALVAPSRKGPPKWVGWLVGLAIALAGLSAATAIWYSGTSGNEYCMRTCHSMADASESWSVSAHSSVACVRCHEGRRWESLPLAMVNRTSYLINELTGHQGAKNRVPARNCLSCHESVIRKPLIARNGETFLHGEALTVNKGCTRCHGAQGHELGNP